MPLGSFTHSPMGLFTSDFENLILFAAQIIALIFDLHALLDLSGKLCYGTGLIPWGALISVISGFYG